MKNNVKCLTTVPSDDGNFKASLGYASDDELTEAVGILRKQLGEGVKCKARLTAVEREMRRRNI